MHPLLPVVSNAQSYEIPGARTDQAGKPRSTFRPNVPWRPAVNGVGPSNAAALNRRPPGAFESLRYRGCPGTRSGRATVENPNPNGSLPLMTFTGLLETARTLASSP